MPTEIGSQRIPIVLELYKAAREGNINLLMNLFTAEREQQLQQVQPEEEHQVQPGEEVAIRVVNGGGHFLGRPIKSLLGVTYRGDTALHIAAYFGHLEMVRRIWNESRSFLLSGNNKSETPMHYAAQAGKHDVVNELI